MKIKKILSVEDTRQWEEGPDDRFYPVPGSGIENNCGRCGRKHEVHAIVLLDDDKTNMIVGTGCMKADEAEIATQVRSILNSQKTLKKLQFQMITQEELRSEYMRIKLLVDAMTPPKVEIEETEGRVGYEQRELIRKRVYHVGDASSWETSHPSLINGYEWRAKERIECAESFWRENRAKELGMTYDMKGAFNYRVSDLEKRIKKIEEKIMTKLKEGSK